MSIDSAFTQRMERLDSEREKSLAWFLGIFLFWSLCTIALMMVFTILGGFGPGFTRWLPALIILPVAFWTFFLGRYLWIQRRIKADPKMSEALNDEMVRASWFRAAAAGFWSMLAVDVIFTITMTASNIIVSMGLASPRILYFPDIRPPLAIAVGVGVTIGTYLRQRRD